MHLISVSAGGATPALSVSGEHTGLCRTYAGTSVIEDVNVFYKLASGDETESPLRLSEVKFLITDVRTDHPELYFIDSSVFRYHWKFFNDGLGWNMSLIDFNTRTYTDYNRRLIAGSVVIHPSYNNTEYPEGIFTIEFWPSDPIHADEASMALELIAAGMDFASCRVFYHPTGQSQVAIYNNELEDFDTNNVPVILTGDLYEGVSYAALNTGSCCGVLRDGSSGISFSAGDIPVFNSVPNDIGHVAGIITTVPQTPLSHINLKALQNGTPNVYIQNFTETERYRLLLGRYVRFTAFPEGYTIEQIPFAEAVEWLESIRPDTMTVLAGELGETRIQSLDEIRLSNALAYGAKAANLGELTWCLPSFSVPDGYAVPFYYYRSFMKHNDLYNAVDSMISLDEFNGTARDREEILRSVRRLIRDSEVPPWMMDSLSVMAAQFDPGTPIRCRSSTNNEDLPGFNGAGLYNSFTHHPDEGHISETIKQVWAGMWTLRAFEEREFHRIDQMSAAMGVVVHPSFRGEQANGVAVTRNIFNPFVSGSYVNVQLGDDMVTNPGSESVPEEFIVTDQNITGHSVREIQYTGLSNRVASGEMVLSEQQIDQLVSYLNMVHNHYRRLYDVDQDDPYFAMEIEFKITSEGELVVKQARPWVF
jgi:hypothetical protein